MTIYYDSKTGNVARFVEKVRQKTGWECVKVDTEMAVREAGHLITYTTKIGCLPETTSRFMESNSSFVLSVSSSGNMNWGANFALSANLLSKQYGIPVLLKFELSGLEQNVNDFIQQVQQYASQKVDTPQQ